MKAIVLGARRDTRNIGTAVAKEFRDHRWETYENDCYNEAMDRYEIPVLHEESDADALVVTLGKTTVRPFRQMDESAIDEVIFGCLNLHLHAVREYIGVRTDKGGRIVLIGSYAHRHPFTNGTAYCAAKAGLDMAAKTLAWELTDQGFYVYAVHPYHVAGTPMWEEVQEGVMKSRGWTREEADDYARRDIKMERMCRPEDIAPTVHWLCESPEARWMSGSSVELFGGTR